MMANLKYSVMMASVTFVTTVPVFSLAIVWWLLRVEYETARSSNCTPIYISYRVSRLIRLSFGWFSELRFQSPIIKLESVLKHWWKTEQLEISLGIFSPFALFGIVVLQILCVQHSSDKLPYTNLHRFIDLKTKHTIVKGMIAKKQSY